MEKFSSLTIENTKMKEKKTIEYMIYCGKISISPKLNLSIVLLFLFIVNFSFLGIAKGKINRYDLVNRHNPEVNSIDYYSPFTVGNGEFAYTADFTGMQSFFNDYKFKASIMLGTQSNWGWHNSVNPTNYDLINYPVSEYDVNRRKVKIMEDNGSDFSSYLYKSPQRIQLGYVGMEILLKSKKIATISDIKNIQQKLNLWKGEIISSFEVEGEKVTVITFCDPYSDQLFFKVESNLILKERLKFFINFPGVMDAKNNEKESWYFQGEFGSGADWSNDKLHQTHYGIEPTNKSFLFKRILDENNYSVQVGFEQSVKFIDDGSPSHLYYFIPGNKVNTSIFKVNYSKDIEQQFTRFNFPKSRKKSIQYWKNFWKNGAAIDFSGSTDSMALELERRIILSQYLTVIQCSGSMPPQETGLVMNSWFGKIHTEMHWWHGLHFVLWNRKELFEKSMSWYKSIMPYNKKLTNQLGYKGVRWPKSTGPEGIPRPQNIESYLIWQQPHLIYYSEMLFRSNNDKRILDNYSEMVFETADFMADFVNFDSSSQKYFLGPYIIPAQENHSPTKTLNPTFELVYWHWALNVAIEWKKRLGVEIDPHWIEVSENMALPTVLDSVYIAHQNCPTTFSEFNKDHPSMLMAYGFLPETKMINKEIMNKTLTKVLNDWNWSETWGWDYPLVAMTAIRLGQHSKAIDILLMNTQKNTYLNNGHNYQLDILPLYLPGNGGLLAAMALLASSTDNKNQLVKEGWNMKCEGFEFILK